MDAATWTRNMDAQYGRAELTTRRPLVPRRSSEKFTVPDNTEIEELTLVRDRPNGDRKPFAVGWIDEILTVTESGTAMWIVTGNLSLLYWRRRRGTKIRWSAAGNGNAVRSRRQARRVPQSSVSRTRWECMLCCGLRTVGRTLDSRSLIPDYGGVLLYCASERFRYCVRNLVYTNTGTLPRK